MPAQAEKPSNSQRRAVLKNCRLSYPHLFEPRAAVEGADPKFSTTLLIPKSNEVLLQTVKNAIAAAVTEAIPSKWGGKKPAGLRMPLRDGDAVDEETGEYEKPGSEFRGHYFMTASSKTRPGVISGPNRDPAQPEDVWPGEYAHVSVSFYGYNAAGNRGVAAGLNNVWVLGRGERLDGGLAPEDEFANIEESFGDEAEDLLGDIA
jgi:hypothetical protein